MHQIHQAWDGSKIEHNGWNGNLQTDHQQVATWGSPKAGNGHGDGAIVVPDWQDTTGVMPGEGEGWQVVATQADAEVSPDGDFDLSRLESIVNLRELALRMA